MRSVRYVFIVNPKAGSRDRTEEVMSLCKAYFSDGEDWAVIRTEYPGHAEKIAAAEAEKGDEVRVYGYGGDGTLLEIARGLKNHTNAAVGIFPLGSGNDYVRSYGRKEYFLNFDGQIKGHPMKVDMIHTEGGDALNLCSAGLDAKVAYEMIRYKKLPFVSGSMAYNLSLVKCLFQKIGEDFKVTMVTTEGIKTLEGNFIFALAANGQYYGGGYRGAPESISNDGLLDMVLIRKPPLHIIPKMVGLYKRGEHLTAPLFRDLLVYYRGTSMKVEAAKDVVFNRDGECGLQRSESFSVIPAAVNFILPDGVDYGGAMLGERITLRRFREEDYSDFMEFSSDDQVMPIAGSRTLTNEALGRSVFFRKLADPDCFAIELREASKVIGTIKYQQDIRRYHVNSLSIGYELNRNYWNHGYMPEALELMIKNAFENKNIDVLGIGHFEGNDRSRRVIEKCGFKYEGHIRKAIKRFDGEILDDIVYSITKEDYENTIKNNS